MRIAFLGLGLIGGSVARALRSAPEPPALISAWTPAGSGPRAALAAGIIDRVAATPEAAVADADLVVIAAPPRATLELIGRLGHAPGAGSGGLFRTVTDVASTKGAITRAAAAAGIPFVGGHPMAGRETSGFDAADATLFTDRPWVITEAVNGGDPGVVRALADACGARPTELASDAHDALVAAVSHLPLLVSAALVEAVATAPDWPDARALAAGGWRDMSRLARGDVVMGTDIVLTNGPAVVARLRAFRTAIDAWIQRLEREGGPDGAAVADALADARRHLEA